VIGAAKGRQESGWRGSASGARLRDHAAITERRRRGLPGPRGEPLDEPGRGVVLVKLVNEVRLDQGAAHLFAGQTEVGCWRGCGSRNPAPVPGLNDPPGLLVPTPRPNLASMAAFTSGGVILAYFALRVSLSALTSSFGRASVLPANSSASPA
jgi:hypothetical protein